MRQENQSVNSLKINLDQKGKNNANYLAQLQQVASQYGLKTFSFADTVSETIKALEVSPRRRPTRIPLSVWNSSELRVPITFYSKLIAPLLVSSPDTYAPTDQDLEGFFERLHGREPLNIVAYYTLSKSKSPRRTGSPNHLIDLAEVEMLKNNSVITTVARELGYNLGFVIVDENSVFPRDEFFGGSHEDAQTNIEATQHILSLFGSTDRIQIRSLHDSVITELGDDFGQLYATRYGHFKQEILDQLTTGQETPLTKRMQMFLDCISDKGLELLSISPEEIIRLRQFGADIDLTTLQPNLSNYLQVLTAHFATIMDLRSETATRVRESDKIDQFPEYNTKISISAGYTRSKSRWSLLPHPIKHHGRTVFPMHGLAVYDEKGQYKGNAPYYELDEDPAMHVVKLGDKPIGAVASEQITIYER